MLFKSIVRPFLFSTSKSDPESAHEWVISRMEFASRHPFILKIIEAANAYKSPKLERDLLGLHFPNPVGLAGGFDKNGRALPALAALGFGFIEAGCVTQHSQPGNDRPRIFRFPQDSALINRMGFPSEGAEAVAARMAKVNKPVIPVGWQIGKSKITPLEEAVDDYLFSLNKLYQYGDFFTINVSSPNTPGLRQLQDKEPLDNLVQAVINEAGKISQQSNQDKPKPILVKISPDLSEGQIDDVIEICLNRGVQAIIATNTTITRDGLHTETTETGGLSGLPIRPRALEVATYLCNKLEGRIPVIGVGGIFGPDDAKRMFDTGVSLIQIYTGFIYEGPGLIKRINRALDV